MTDRPILFSAPMVRALLDGRKTQTRRIIEPTTKPIQPGDVLVSWPADQFLRKCERFHPRFATGDRLWVREHWRTESKAYDDLAPSDMDADYPVIFAADADWSTNKTVGRHRQAMHMPRWASRLTLTVTDVRVQRLQEITEEDAADEGIVRIPRSLTQHGRMDGYGLAGTTSEAASTTRRNAYALLWDMINGPRAWDANPWICAISFTVDRRNIDA